MSIHQSIIRNFLKKNQQIKQIMNKNSFLRRIQFTTMISFDTPFHLPCQHDVFLIFSTVYQSFVHPIDFPRLTGAQIYVPCRDVTNFCWFCVTSFRVFFRKKRSYPSVPMGCVYDLKNLNRSHGKHRGDIGPPTLDLSFIFQQEKKTETVRGKMSQQMSRWESGEKCHT